MSWDENPVLSELRRSRPERRLAGRNVTKADILVHRLAGVEIAVKDYSARPWAIRNTVGRWLIRREARAYRRLAGIEGLPEFCGRVGSFALAIGWVDARPLAESRDKPVDAAVFDRIASILESFHQRGVAHSDLHQRDVLLTPDGSVYLVDLASAWLLGDRPGRLRRAVFERLRDADRVALARMRARWTGASVAAAPAAVGERAAAWHRRGRSIKRVLGWFRGTGRSI